MTRLKDLPFEADSDVKPRTHRRRRRSRTPLTLLLTLVLLGTLGLGGWFGYDKVRGFFATEDYSGAGNGVEVEVQVEQGASGAQIGNALVEADVVASVDAFVEAYNAHPDGNMIQAGTYRLQEQMSGKAAVEALLDPDNRIVAGATIREGLEYWNAFAALEEETGIPAAEFEEYAQDPAALGIPEFWFVDEDGEMREDVTVEGFLFPQTYQFQPDQTALEILQQMVLLFLNTAEELDFVDTVEQDLGLHPYDALNVASISQAEAGNEEDLPKVARVMYNRLYEEFGCDQCLQSDVTTRYWIERETGERKGSVDLSSDDLYNEDNPFSTHAHQGLPPTPINSPGEAALRAAMDPAEGDWFYFVAVTQDGETAFAETLDEHCANVDTAVENGVLEYNSC